MRVYFDFDGPVVRNRRKFGAVHAAAVERQQQQPMPASLYWRLKRYRVPEAEICALVSRRLDPKPYLAFRANWIEHPRFVALDRLVPGFVETASALRAAGHSVRLATLRKRADVLEEQLAMLGVRDLFDAVLCEQDNDGLWRTKAQMIGADAGFLAGDSMLVGDTEGDVLAARSLGMAVVAVSDGIRAAAMLRLFSPDLLIRSSRNLDIGAIRA